jgi:hypothetical protein
MCACWTGPRDLRLPHAAVQQRDSMPSLSQRARAPGCHRFVGLESVSRAEARLHSGRSSGKVYVQVPHDLTPREALQQQQQQQGQPRPVEPQRSKL